MKTLDMSDIKSYKNMTKNIETRKIGDKKVLWPNLENHPLDSRFCARFVSENDFEKAALLWKKSYPELYGSSKQYSWVFYPEEYKDKVLLKENFDSDSKSKQFCMVIVIDMENNNEFAGAALYKKDDENLQIEFSIGGIHPDYRKGSAGDKLVPMVLYYLKDIEDYSGAEYLSAFCETWHDISQYLCLKVWGWKLAGIFPGQFTRWSHDQEEYRGCTIHFYKLINGAENITTLPKDWHLLPEIESLWQNLEKINSSSRDFIKTLKIQ
ncbi:MAG: hypothetical protein RBR08_12185 [Desulforegulaceae bacterium]|nr:hypothetical protein [Desulforegulaceae bacterium]